MTTASPASTDTTTPWKTPAPPATRSVAVVGLGHQGLTHAAPLSTIPGARLAALVDPRRAARDTARRVGFAAPAFRDLPTLLARARPDVVVVAGPQDERAQASRLALEAGCAVLSERPAAHRLEDAETLWTLAEARGLRSRSRTRSGCCRCSPGRRPCWPRARWGRSSRCGRRSTARWCSGIRPGRCSIRTASPAVPSRTWRSTCWRCSSGWWARRSRCRRPPA